MFRLSPRSVVLGFGALAGCAEDQSPTQPGSGPDAESSAAVGEALASSTWTLKAAQPDFAFGTRPPMA